MTDEQIVKYLTGACSPVEIQELEAWVNADPANRDYFNKMEQTWVLTAAHEAFDTEKAWARVSQRIEAHDNAGTTPVRKLYDTPVFRLAAAAILIIAVFFLTDRLNTKTTLSAGIGESEETTLDDGSRITLNAGSSLKYPKSFDKSVRSVELKGEAYFDIERDTSRPFLVKTRRAEIEVLGTSFNIRENEDSLIIVVSEGVVALRALKNKGDEDVVLRKGEQGFFNYATNKAFKTVETASDALFWYNRSLSFKATPLPLVIQTLEKNYDVRFNYQEEQIAKCFLTTRFEAASLEEIIAVIETTFGITIISNGGEFQVNSNDEACTDM